MFTAKLVSRPAHQMLKVTAKKKTEEKKTSKNYGPLSVFSIAGLICAADIDWAL